MGDFKFNEEQRAATRSEIIDLCISAINGVTDGDVDAAIDRIEQIINKRDGWIRVEVHQDDSGHWYVVPEDKMPEYREALTNIGNQEEYSDTWYDAINEFINKFSEYRTGGDLNNVALYLPPPKSEKK